MLVSPEKYHEALTIPAQKSASSSRQFESPLPSIGNKIRPAIPPLQRWRERTIGAHFEPEATSIDPCAVAARAIAEDPKHAFRWDDVDMVMGALETMNLSAASVYDQTPFLSNIWGVHLWHIAEKMASLLPPREQPPHEGLDYGLNQALAAYPIGSDGRPASDGENRVSAAAVLRCLSGGILGDLRQGKIGHATQLTLFTLEGILRAITRARTKGICSPPAVIFHAYQRWLRTRFSPLVPGTLESLDGWLVNEPVLHGSVRAGQTTWKVIKAGEAGSLHTPVNQSFGADALVRVAPAAFFGEEPFRLASEIAALTHGHPEALQAAGAFALIVSHVVRGRTLEFGVREAVKRLEQERARELAVALCDAYLWGRHRPDANAVYERFPKTERAGDALCLAVLAATSCIDGRELRGDPWEGPESYDEYSSVSRTVRVLRGQLLGCIRGASLPQTDLGSQLLRVVERLAGDVETEFRDDYEWWKLYPGW
ncbi:ADP-ribosylglycohydrolase family protein [Gemmatimonas sp.]|uniref:ADP-ribosylglycohydrolase family protein n=1 Tax=Gemmatimonas sp. TaxID=1962908 RepID=UPI0037BF0ACC